MNLPLPFLFFTYQILNIDEETQVLMSEVLGPAGLPVHRIVYIRHVDGAATTHTRGYKHTVREYFPDPLTTPDGHKMRMPKRFAWRVAGDDGADSSRSTARPTTTSRTDSARDTSAAISTPADSGALPITGTGYIEWIDRR